MPTMYNATIDDLTGREGETVTLLFCGSVELGNRPYEEDAKFLGIGGAGEDRRARFKTSPPGWTGQVSYEWDAYRFVGRWVYGTSAEPLRVCSFPFNPA